MNHEQLLARPSLWASLVNEEPRIYVSRGLDSGAGHWREQRAVFGGEWRAPESAAVFKRKRPCGCLLQNRNLPGNVHLLPELPRLAKRQPLVCLFRRLPDG